MGVRLRQIALVGQDLDWSVATLTALFDTYVAFRDPGIVPAFGGMFNALLAMGDCFLEIVSPTDGGYAKSSTSVRLLRKNGGDCGYMAILQVDDIAHTSTRLSRLGRAALAMGVVVQGGPGEGTAQEKGFRYKVGEPLAKAPGTTASALVQWHPKDFGTLMETEEQWPAARGAEGAWLPAGNRWQRKYGRRSSSVCEEFAGVVVAVPGGAAGAGAIAAKWAEGLECPLVEDGRAVQLEGSVVRFVPVGDDGRDGIIGVDLYAVPGKPKAFTECHVHGVTWRLVDRPGAEGSTAPLFETVVPAAKL
mmetsp:Transcript_58538/g.174223  ORF Transcript_58538/g.174223 Transcript_58538/m.174223 type:complete len:305 (-) Transcript_58538:14-928(-)